MPTQGAIDEFEAQRCELVGRDLGFGVDAGCGFIPLAPVCAFRFFIMVNHFFTSLVFFPALMGVYTQQSCRLPIRVSVKRVLGEKHTFTQTAEAQLGRVAPTTDSHTLQLGAIPNPFGAWP